MVIKRLRDFFRQMFTAHAQKRLFMTFRSSIWPCHSLRRPRFSIRRVYFHYRMTFTVYIWWFCAQFSYYFVTLTFDLLILAMFNELNFIHPTHIPSFSILRLSVTELWVTHYDHIIVTLPITITLNGHCARAVSRDLCIVGPPKPHETIFDPKLFIHYRGLQLIWGYDDDD